jgi:hypothetical protein
MISILIFCAKGGPSVFGAFFLIDCEEININCHFYFQQKQRCHKYQ